METLTAPGDGSGIVGESVLSLLISNITDDGQKKILFD